jgi:DHA2 family multidrug resistance protein
LGALAPERLKLASGLFNLMRNLGGAIGIAACGTILNDRGNLHFLRLAEHLTTSNSASMNLLHTAASRYTDSFSGDAVHGNLLALQRLWALTWREAQVQTFADAFVMIALCFAVAALLVPLMRKGNPPRTAPGEAH